ncbi:MAG: hypothetical protein EA401_02275 [Planctomycetota bacterium]|nr:MAG: hypothetical protein EA401_02275 [Planctomycetota bacterium]
MALLLVVMLVLVAQWRRPSPSPVPQVPREEVQAWMLQTGHGIGPVTASEWLHKVREHGSQVLPEPARGQLSPLIAEPGNSPQQ